MAGTETNRGELFHEEQRFRQPWLWWTLMFSVTAGTVPLLAGVYQQLIRGRPWGRSPMSDGSLVLFATFVVAICAGVVALMWFARLVVVVSERALEIRFSPFHLSPREVPLARVSTVEAVTYSPLKWGGWGIRYSFEGKAYNVSGNQGVVLTFTDGKRLLIGSQRKDELAKAIESARRALGEGERGLGQR